MKLRSRILLLCAGVVSFSLSAQARRHHAPKPLPGQALATPAPEPPALPVEAAPQIKSDAPPSLSLQPFVDTHLGKVLAPLGESAFAQPEYLASMKAGYADGMASAPGSHKPAYQLAQSVCDAVMAAMTERQNAVAALRGALATRSSEAEQPRGGAAEGTAKARAGDNFFIDSQKNNWSQHAGILRQNINALYLRERAVERQIGVWSPAPPAVTAPVVGVTAPPKPGQEPTPPSMAAAPVAPVATSSNASVQGQDPVAGEWVWGGHQAVTLNGNLSIAGSRHGSWHYVSTTPEGRSYEFHWKYHGAVDYMVLSSDGKTLEGKNVEGAHVSAQRR